MTSFTDFGESWADAYDAKFPTLGDDDPLIRFITEALSNAGAIHVLEFGIGTGRVSLPLARAGFAVTGIDVSKAMLNKLLANPESRSIETVEGSITEVQLPRTFDAVICVFNTLCTLISQEDQLQALLKAAAHLRPDGLLILENSSPVHALRGFRFNHALAAPGVGCMNGDEFFMVAAEHFPIEQLVRMRYLFLSTRGTEIFPVDLRYIWPAELDMMAQVAGFRLIRRYGGWPAQPFTEASEMHIECYAKISISGDNAKGGR